MAPTVQQPARPLSLFALAITGILLSGLLGAATNAVNGWVSPHYFITVLRWQGVEDVWRASIAQGILEGLVVGVVFSLVFTGMTGYITGASCPYTLGLKYLLAIVPGALIFWGLGGTIAIGLATLSPEFYQRTFYGVPDEPAAMRAYAWVGGSIWGLEFGGLVCVILGLIVLRSEWLQQQASTQDAPESPS